MKTEKGRSDLDPWSARFFNFKSVELVRIGTGAARITRVTRPRVEYVDEIGREQFVDLEECARIWICLERTGLFPPSDETDWARLADATPEFSKLELSSSDSNTVGLRSALDSPPWFQFLNRRRTQFEFKNGHSFETDLHEPLGKAGWQSFDAC